MGDRILAVSRSGVLRRLGVMIAACAIAAIAGASASKAADRVALVIGISTHAGAGTLATIGAEIGAVARTLQEAGYRVVADSGTINATGLRGYLSIFEDYARGADFALVYVAAPGFTHEERGVLVPSDARLDSARHVEDETVPVSRILSMLRRLEAPSLVLLDISHENPFVARLAPSGSVRPGLAIDQVPEGQVVVVSTLPVREPVSPEEIDAGASATRAPSAFAAASAEAFSQPGATLAYVLDALTDGTGGGVAIAHGMPGDPFFVVGAPGSASPQEIASDTDDGIASRDEESEALAARRYEFAERVGTLAAFQAFIAAHPVGFYADLARAQIEKLDPDAVRSTRLSKTESETPAEEPEAAAGVRTICLDANDDEFYPNRERPLRRDIGRETIVENEARFKACQLAIALEPENQELRFILATKLWKYNLGASRKLAELARQGHVAAMAHGLWLHGHMTEAERLDFLQRAIDAGYAPAIQRLANSNSNPVRALSLLERAWRAGVRDAGGQLLRGITDGRYTISRELAEEIERTLLDSQDPADWARVAYAWEMSSDRRILVRRAEIARVAYEAGDQFAATLHAENLLRGRGIARDVDAGMAILRELLRRNPGNFMILSFQKDGYSRFSDEEIGRVLVEYHRRQSDNSFVMDMGRGAWRVAQRILRDEGHYSGPIDGVPGPMTKRALGSLFRAHFESLIVPGDPAGLRSLL